MKLKNKIALLLFFSYLVVSAFLTSVSIFTLQKSQKENIDIFKGEFLELGRELFNNNSDLFFKYLNSENEINKNSGNTSKTIIDLVKENDPQGKNTIIIDTVNKDVVRNFNNVDLNNFLDQAAIEKVIQENILNQKSNFDFDNFENYAKDTSNKVLPIQIHLHSYENDKVIIGYGKVFTTAKIRIQYIQKQNDALINSYVILVFLIFLGTALVAIILMILLMHNLITKPLKKISLGLKQIKEGKLGVKIDVKQKNEIGEIANNFNEMTSDLEKSRQQLEEYSKTLEEKVKSRTEELSEKVQEFEKMNNLMVGREVKMIELKKRISELGKK